MKNYFAFLLLFSCIFNSKLIAQIPSRQAITDQTLRDWEMVELNQPSDAAINADGSYFCYYLSKRYEGKRKLIIQSTRDEKKYEYPNANAPLFLPGGTTCIFMLGDTLNRLNLRTGLVEKTKNVGNLRLIGIKKSLLIYELEGYEKELIIENLENGKILRFTGINEYSLDSQEQYAVLKKKSGKRLSWLDLQNGKETTFWNGDTDMNVMTTIFDQEAQKLAFVVQKNKANSIWLYDRKTAKVQLKATNGVCGLPFGRKIGQQVFISNDGKHIFFQLEDPIIQKAPAEAVRVDIWNFKDPVLQDQQLVRLSSVFTSRWYAINIQTSKILPINEDGKYFRQSIRLNGYALISKESKDRYWEVDYNYSNRSGMDELLNLETGTSIKIPVVKGLRNYYASPDGKWLFIWGGQEGKEQGYSFSFATKKLMNVTSNVKSELFADDHDEGNNVATVAGWIPDEDAVLIYDRFDIWKLDLRGRKVPQNLTGGYGWKNKIKLRISEEVFDKIVHKNDRLLLTAFNIRNKDNGFYRLDLHKPGKPDSLSMRKWISNAMQSGLFPINDHVMVRGFTPKLAAKQDVWLVFGQSASDAPNFYLSNDLKSFKRLTNYQPHRNLNWYTTELKEWSQSNGRTVQGILYKPLDFDSTKKYPVIIYHYRMLSHCLNEYKIPDYTSSAEVNIPWFVNNGYLVLTPDVYLTKGGSGPAALKVTESAATWLSTLQFVDKKRIGLTGHSQAGFQANYISANTNVFACIFSGAGGSDIMSSYFYDAMRFSSGGGVTEHRYGLPWENPESWTKRSPLYHADLVGTPLLMYHCKKDNTVPFALSRQYFMALWRLGKPVWLLQYDEGGHAQRNLKDAKDLTIRITQFFDHYLKGAPAPVWMTRGIPAYKKGIDTGLQLDVEESKNLSSNPYLKN